MGQACSAGIYCWLLLLPLVFCEEAFLREGRGCGFYRWVPSVAPAGSREDPLLGFTSGIEKKRIVMKFRGLIRPNYEIYTTHCPFDPLDKKEGTI